MGTGLLSVLKTTRRMFSTPDNGPKSFPCGSNGALLMQALEARGLPYRYLSPEEVTNPRLASRPIAAFHVNNVPYYFGLGLRVSGRRGSIPGPLIEGPDANFLKRKDLVETFLRNHGYSVPEGAAFAGSAENEAEGFFKDFSPPPPEGVCIKPADGRTGQRVHLGVRDLASFHRAFRAIAEYHERVLIEELVSGAVYRFFWLDGRVIAIRVGLPANVVGDGTHSIADLVKLKDAKRRLNPVHAGHRLRLGQKERNFLSQAGLDPSDVPEAGKSIFLSDLSNLHRGADIIDATDDVHPSYIETVEGALRLFPDLVLCGADVVIEDATRPATADNYHILELNCGAGFSSHHYPWRGQPRDVAGAIVDYLITSRPSSTFIEGSDGHCVVQALEARGIPYGYLSPGEVTRRRLAGKPVVGFQINNASYFFALGLRISDPSGGIIPGPSINDPDTSFVKRKDLLKTFLRDHGFSVPDGAVFAHEDQDQAEAFFKSFASSPPDGICVKPAESSQGELLHVPICDLTSFRRAFRTVAKRYGRVLVEHAVQGTVYRFFGLSGRVIAIYFGLPANVVGDGIHSIDDLVKLKDAERRLNPVHAGHRLRLGQRERNFLSQAGLDPGDVPEAGKLIFLSDLSNLHRGADIIDATDDVHPSYVETVERALSLFPGLVLCGADVAIEDATQPATADNHHLLECNCDSGLSSHHYPWRGQPRDVAGAIVDYLVTSRHSSVTTFIEGSNGHYVVQALEARDIPYRYLSPEEITHPRFVKARVVAFQINNVPYFFASGLRVSDPRGKKVPGPLIDGPTAPFVKCKHLIEVFLRRNGFSVPDSASFHREAHDQAETFFEAFSPSLPDGVCVKPADGCLGRLVHLEIRDRESFRTAFSAVAKYHERVVIDEMVRGTVYRFFCLAGRVIAIRFGRPANVEGDGVHTIADLVKLKNAERCLNPSAYFQSHLRLSERETAFLRRTGLDPSDVPDAGTTVFLNSLSNVHQAADIIDVTDDVHPSYIETVERALRLFPDLVLCGADVVIEDATRPATVDNYHILELNCGAGFSDHIVPWRGQPRDVAGAIVDYLITSRHSSVTSFIEGSDGHCLLQALEGRGIPYRYLSPGEVTRRPFAGQPVVGFQFNNASYFFALGLRISDPSGGMVPGPSINDPDASFVKRKDLLKTFLRDHGFSVPDGSVFAREDQDQAEAFFKSFVASPTDGICVKPAESSQGKLVHVRIREIGPFREAFVAVAKRYGRVLVEHAVQGTVYRFFGLSGRVIAIHFGLPANVVGDGIHSIDDLVKLKDAERRLNPVHAGHRLRLGRRERNFLSQAGLDPRDVPEAGKLIFLSDLSNLHRGADIIDATDAVHQSYTQIVERVLSLIPGLILCGADVIIEDAMLPATAENYHILALNSGPDFSNHHYPWQGQTRDVAGSVVDYLAGA